MINNALKFKYLGSISQIDDCSVGCLEMSNRITAANAKFFELYKFFTNHKILLKTRLQFLNSLVKTRLTYMCQCQVFTKVQFDKFDSEFIKLIRFMIRGGRQKRMAQVYTRNDGTQNEFSKYLYTNNDIVRMSGVELVSSYIKRQQTNWVNHAIRSDDSCFVKRLTFPDYPAGTKKKTGILQTPYKQVLKYYRDMNITEAQMLADIMKRQRLA